MDTESFERRKIAMEHLGKVSYHVASSYNNTGSIKPRTDEQFFLDKVLLLVCTR